MQVSAKTAFFRILLGLTHTASKERVSTGIPALDEMLEGKGYYRGSSILLSGSAGTGKSSLAARFAEYVCSQGETCLYFAFEESPSQIMRNMGTLGIRLDRCARAGTLRFHAVRPSNTGLEMHLAVMQKMIAKYNPTAVVIDPLTSIFSAGNPHGAQLMFTRLIDFLKMRGITSAFTNLTSADGSQHSYEGVSSLMDTWIRLHLTQANGTAPKRILTIVKSRGMAHEREGRELIMKKGRLDVVQSEGLRR